MIDQSSWLQERVAEALQTATPLRLIGGDSKQFYGGRPRGTALYLGGHRGIVNYQPKELVISVRAGTLLSEVEQALAQQGQCLPFDPPRFSDATTIGGMVCAGLSGPSRPFVGALRDYVLGVRLINGKAEMLRFGGEVMKNVAGYDLSRLMCGAMGTLGLILEVSLKVMPQADAQQTRCIDCSPAEALERMQQLRRQSLPLSAAAHIGERLYVRISTARSAQAAAVGRIGGEALDEPTATDLWSGLRDHRHPFFAGEAPLWRISLPPGTGVLGVDAPMLIDWAGAQRWLRGEYDRAQLQALVAGSGGHLTRFRRAEGDETVFQPLPPALLALHRRVKSALDPQGIFNPGRLYPEV